MGEGINLNARRSKASSKIESAPSHAHDWIRVYLGLMGSGKTTKALQDLEKRERVIIYSPGTSNPLMRKYPFIYDTPEYLKDFERFRHVYPKLRIEKKAAPTTMFRIFSQLKGYTIVLDDVAALKTQAQERTEFEAFIRTVRFNGNKVIITTHRAAKDLPPLVHVVGTSFFYVGPSTRSKRELETLFELTNFPIDYEDFKKGLQENPQHHLYPIRKP